MHNIQLAYYWKPVVNLKLIEPKQKKWNAQQLLHSINGYF
jgi:hypothetical protein